MVNVGKDLTFNSVYSDWWDGTETPKEVADLIKEKTSIAGNIVSIVYEVDTDNWYIYLADQSPTDNRQGWYSGGVTK